MKRIHKTNQEGFTIVELLIATAVLSMIILLTTVMITSIGNLYYKGVIQSRTQANARTITDDISQHLKFTDGDVWQSTQVYSGKTINSYCINGARYSYIVGVQLGQINHVLWRDVPSGSCAPVDITLVNPLNADGSASVGGTEMIAPSSRLTAFSITQTTLTSPLSISVGVAYGEVSLTTAASGPDVRCLGGAGDRFCASVYLATTVTQRSKGN